MKTAAQRKADERTRMRKLGFKAMQMWVHEDDQAQARKYVDRLNKRRLPSTDEGKQ